MISKNGSDPADPTRMVLERMESLLERMESYYAADPGSPSAVRRPSVSQAARSKRPLRISTSRTRHSKSRPMVQHYSQERLRPVSVIFPAFNEEGNIARTVETTVKVLPKVAANWEIVVVDDGSSDATAPICMDLQTRYPELVLIRHARNRGYGAALKSGIKASRYELVFFSDSDGQFDLRELQQLICWSEDYDIIVGYRANRHDPLYRRINALGWNFLVRLVLGMKIRDVDCAFKLFRREVFDHVRIRSRGAMVNTEILAQAMRLGMRIQQVKVHHFPRHYGKQSGANIHVIIKAFRELCRLWRRLRHISPDQPGLYSAAGASSAAVENYHFHYKNVLHPS